jgi:Sigma-70 region 2
MDAEELTRILAAAGRGEQAAWNSLVARFEPMMRAIARARRLNDPDVDDVCQTVWLQLFKYIDTIVEARAISGWLATTTKNAALHVLRSRDRAISVDAVSLEDREALAGRPWRAAERSAHPTSVCCRPSTRPRFRRASPRSRPGSGQYLACWPPIRRFLTSRSADGSAFRSGASGQLRHPQIAVGDLWSQRRRARREGHDAGPPAHAFPVRVLDLGQTLDGAFAGLVTARLLRFTECLRELGIVAGTLENSLDRVRQHELD